MATKITTPELFNLQYNNTEGTQLPVMTRAERIAMTGMSNGELIFNSTTDSVEYYDAGAAAWYKIDYSSIYPASLKMYLNASDTASYPGTGTTWFDLTSNGNNGAISNASWNSGGYFNFNGTNSKVDLGTSFANNASQATYAAWVNFDNLNTQNFIIFPDSGSTGHGFGFFDYGNGNIYFQSDNGTNSNRGVVSNSGLYTAGSWVHMAQVYDGSATGNASRLKAYINGNQVTLTFSGTIPSTTGTTSYNTLVGTRVQNNYSLDGKISKVHIYDTALTQAEITALYNETWQ